MNRHPPQFFLSLYGWTFWVPILLAGGCAIAVCLLLPGMAWLSIPFAIVTFACLAFYRDFPRPVPKDAGIMVAPADGKITEISQLDHYPPFNGPALRIGIFLSVLDVHVNRAPCDGVVLWTHYQEGAFLDARHPDCSRLNQSNTICIAEQTAAETSGTSSSNAAPAAVVKQIVGAIARRIIAPVTPGERWTRGQRIGMIAFGSRTELYVPASGGWQPAIAAGTHVKGGKDILLRKT